MPRKTRRAALSAPTGNAKPGLLGYIVTGIVCAALGGGGTYLALRPAVAQATRSHAAVAEADRLQGDQQEDQGQWAQAITSYQRAITEGADNPDIRTDLGVAYFKSNQPQKALEQYLTAQRQNPNHENSLFNEASAYAVLGDGKRAVSLWQSYLQKFPSGQHVADAKNFIARVQAHPLAPAAPGKVQ